MIGRRPPAGELPLTPVLRAGNRFGVASVGFALLAVLGVTIPGLDQLAWALAPMAVVVGAVGLVLHANDRATNRTDIVIGSGVAYLVLVVLLFKLVAAYPVVPMPIVPLT